MSSEGYQMWKDGSLQELKRPQLQKLCKDAGLKASGKNNEMVERLNELYANMNEDQVPIAQFEMESVAEVVETEKQEEQKEQYLEDLEAAIVELDLKESEMMHKRTKSAAEVVLEKFQQRVEDELKEFEEQQKLNPSKSYVSLSDKTLQKRPSSRWDDVHQKEFEKMGSISKHYAAKRSTVSLKAVNEEHAKQVEEGVATAAVEETSVETPKKTSIFQKIMNLSSSKKKVKADSADKSKGAKKPSVVSKSMAFFKKAPAKVAVSKPLPAAPIVKKPVSGTINKTVAPIVKKPMTTMHTKTTVASAAKSVMNDENKKTAVNAQSTAAMKKKFDLKASLAKPLSYKPYTGKLVPVAPVTDKSGVKQPLGVSMKQSTVSSK